MTASMAMIPMPDATSGGGIPGSRGSAGFTLIELVTVIVILGILAATALPRFVSISKDAQESATAGIAAAITSASNINHAACKIRSTNCITIAECADAANLLQGGLPSGYSIGLPGFPIPIAANTSLECAVVGPQSTQKDAIVTGTP